MVNLCAVKSCSNAHTDKKRMEEPLSVSFFRAKNPTVLQQWTQSLEIALKPTDKICQYHFPKKDIKFYEKIVIGNSIHIHYLLKKTLKEGAVPTIDHQFQVIYEWEQQPKPKQIKQLHQQPEEQQISSEEQPTSSKEQHTSSEPQPTSSEQQQAGLEQKHQLEKIQEITQPIDFLKNNLFLPQFWFYVEHGKEIEFMRFDPARKQIRNHIVVNEDFSVTVICSNNQKVNLLDKISLPNQIFEYLKSVENWPLCVGTQIERERYSKNCKGVIIANEAYQRNQIHPRCVACRVLRSRLQSRANTFNSPLVKSIARKRHTENIARQCKRLKKSNIKLKQQISAGKANCDWWGHVVE